jgi:hypothetical protein
MRGGYPSDMDHSLDASACTSLGHGYRATSTPSDSGRDVAAQFEALLFKEAFAPLAKAMGFYGDSVVSAAAQSMTRSADTGLADPLAAAMDCAARDGAQR